MVQSAVAEQGNLRQIGISESAATKWFTTLYSVRNACIGSVFAALLAGTTAAINAAASSTSVAIISTSGSYGLMPYSWFAMARPPKIVAGIPMANPIMT